MPDAAKKIALITGANKGIGFEVARQIGRTGAIVLLGARNKLAGEKAAATLADEGLAVRFIAIDVTDEDSVSAAAAAIANNFGRLDILVNNAGITDPADGQVPVARLDAVERIWRTNFLGAPSTPVRPTAAGAAVVTEVARGSLGPAEAGGAVDTPLTWPARVALSSSPRTPLCLTPSGSNNRCRSSSGNGVPSAISRTRPSSWNPTVK